MSNKTDLEHDACRAAQDLLAHPDWAGAQSEIEIALWLARRGAQSQFAENLIDPETCAPAPRQLTRQRHASVPAYGWTGLLNLAFGLMEEEMDKTQSPFSAWLWQDIKSKFGTLRLSGGPMMPTDAVCFNAAQHVGLDLYDVRYSKFIDPVPHALINAEISMMGFADPIEIDEYGRLCLSARDQTQAEELYGKASKINVRLLEGIVDLAEDLSGCLCETCGRPGVSMGSGWISTCCDQCSAQNGKPTPGKQPPQPCMPIAHLALAALRQCIWRSFSSKNPRRPADPSQIALAAEALAPIAKLAIHGLDLATPLPQGASLIEYMGSLSEMIWLESFGVDPLAHQGSDGKTPIARLIESNPAEGSAAEHWFISRTSKHQPSAQTPARRAL